MNIDACFLYGTELRKSQAIIFDKTEQRMFLVFECKTHSNKTSEHTQYDTTLVAMQILKTMLCALEDCDAHNHKWHTWKSIKKCRHLTLLVNNITSVKRKRQWEEE